MDNVTRQLLFIVTGLLGVGAACGYPIGFAVAMWMR